MTKKRSSEIFALKIAHFGENRKLFLMKFIISQTGSTTPQTSKQIDATAISQRNYEGPLKEE